VGGIFEREIGGEKGRHPQRESHIQRGLHILEQNSQKPFFNHVKTKEKKGGDQPTALSEGWGRQKRRKTVGNARLLNTSLGGEKTCEDKPFISAQKKSLPKWGPPKGHS